LVVWQFMLSLPTAIGIPNVNLANLISLKYCYSRKA
jgi:hypothetical protein